MELEELLQSTLARLFARLGPLRAARVTADPAAQLTLDGSIAALEDAARELEAMLATLGALLDCCPAAEARVRALCAEEVRLRAACAESADEAARLRYEGQIAEARAQRDALAQEQFERVLRALDFFTQRRAFRHAIDRERLASVVIRGDDAHGLYWLGHRLRDLMRPANPLVLCHSFGAAVLDQALPGLLRNLARQLGVAPRGPADQLAGAVIDAIGKRWAHQSVVLRLDHVELLGPAGLGALLDGLWAPLCGAVQAGPKPLGHTSIAALLFCHSIEPASAGAPPPAAPGAPPQAPLSMELPPFDEAILTAWIDAHLEGGVPPALHDPDRRRDILERWGGVPCDVVDELCSAWPSDWYTGSNIKNEWFNP